MLFRSIPFVESELQEIEEAPKFPGAPRLANVKIRNTPVSPRENMRALYFEKKPFYIPMPGENRSINPKLYSEKLGRGQNCDSVDHFGLHWEYEPTAGGSIVRPGNPILDDVNNWRDVIKMPDINEWDWAAEAEKYKIDLRFPAQMSFVNGFWFERLISMMEFEGALMALFDEDQKDYYSIPNLGNGSLFGVPATVMDPSFAGFALEAISEKSVNTTYDAYIDKKCKLQDAPDADAAKCLDIIFEGIVYDLGFINDLGGLGNLLKSSMATATSNNYVRLLQRVQFAAETQINKIKEKYPSIDH